ncbi:hypothetical protein DSM110093_04189 (plasmid) [Sulfitobacter sp. DSM 110093]|nr:hypothetical protein DSM110093_04189 [Sulfitobacter sp. DSM 110093]
MLNCACAFEKAQAGKELALFDPVLRRLKRYRLTALRYATVRVVALLAYALLSGWQGFFRTFTVTHNAENPRCPTLLNACPFPI